MVLKHFTDIDFRFFYEIELWDQNNFCDSVQKYKVKKKIKFVWEIPLSSLLKNTCLNSIC